MPSNERDRVGDAEVRFRAQFETATDAVLLARSCFEPSGPLAPPRPQGGRPRE